MGAKSTVRPLLRRQWKAMASVLVIGVVLVVAAIVGGRLKETDSGVASTAPPAPNGDWTRRPAELFTAPGQLVAASASRFLFATVSTQTTYRYTVTDLDGQSVGDGFDAAFGACVRSRSGALGCHIGSGFFLLDLVSGERTRIADMPDAATSRGPIAAVDGWVVGRYGRQLVLAESGEQRWWVPADENVVDLSQQRPAGAPVVVTYQPTTGHRRARAADTGKVLVECDCVITLVGEGFATEATGGSTALYTAAGVKTATLPDGVRVIGGASEVLVVEPRGKVDAGPSPYRVRTPGGRTVWEGTSVNGAPRACGDWLLTPESVVAIGSGKRFSSSVGVGGSYDCLGSGDGWIAMPDRVIVPDGHGWLPRYGTLSLVDGRLVNGIGGAGPMAAAVVAYSPTQPAGPGLPGSTGAADFTARLDFADPRGPTGSGRTEISRVTYSPDSDHWVVGADHITQQGKSTVHRRLAEAIVLSGRGETIGTTPDNRNGRACGPYLVSLAADVGRVVVRRDDGGAVRVESQPDPDHAVAAGARCVGHSEDYLALTVDDRTGIVLLPLRSGLPAQRLPGATGFVAGRPIAVSAESSTLTVFPPVRG